MRREAENPWLSIVGIGEDGWDGLGPQARALVDAAEVLVGSTRQLAHVPAQSARRIAWPSPLLPYLDELLMRERGRAVTVLASGDPMLYGVGTIVAQKLASSEFRVIPNVSALSLACARLGWPVADVALVSAVNRPLEAVAVAVQPGRRIVVYCENGTTPAELALLLIRAGYGGSAMSAFERLGGACEMRRDATAAHWSGERLDDLCVVAVTCVPDASTTALATSPGLPDEAFESDGALTKREVRAATLARLVPLPGNLLWDLGAGSGSIGIEWMRVHVTCRAIAIERSAERAARIARNARALGVPALRIITGTVPEALNDLNPPDAVFIGGGLLTPGLVEQVWGALRPGGRLVANVVTIEGESALAAWHTKLGGDLVRIAISRAAPVGTMLAWRPLMPITQWTAVKR
ncbi:MAG: precorrin-6y C5,15-methyltransferase (decarboxylating) subunit CbiE [Candidatus Velthaea sp.]